MASNAKEYQKAIQYLCNKMQDGTIQLGDRLPTERALAEELEISRPSTREALRTLENMGIIESRRGSGSYFTGNISKKLSEMIRLFLMLQLVTPQDICDFRRTMEKSACQSIIDRGSFDISELTNVLSAPVQGILEEAEQDRQFHYLLVQASRNHFWIAIMDAVCDVYRDWVATALECADSHQKQQLHSAHMAMLSSLQSGNRSACDQAIDLHYHLIDRLLSDHLSI